MKRKSMSFAALAVSIGLGACGNKASRVVEETPLDLPEVEETVTPPSDSMSPSSTSERPGKVVATPPPTYESSDDDVDDDDNMRGFDPASEDDMDDNGMSRYMENYDEEGWN